MTVDHSSDAFVHEDPEPARALRQRLRALMAEHLPDGWLGPFTTDPADLELSNRFCEVLAAKGFSYPTGRPSTGARTWTWRRRS